MVENSLWKRLWTCRKTDYRMNRMNEYNVKIVIVSTFSVKNDLPEDDCNSG
jgi:hypothetical protein